MATQITSIEDGIQRVKARAIKAQRDMALVRFTETNSNKVRYKIYPNTQLHQSFSDTPVGWSSKLVGIHYIKAGWNPQPVSYLVWRMTNPVIDLDLRDALRPFGARVTVATHLVLGGHYESAIMVPQQHCQGVEQVLTDAGIGWSVGA